MNIQIDNITALLPGADKKQPFEAEKTNIYISGDRIAGIGNKRTHTLIYGIYAQRS